MVKGLDPNGTSTSTIPHLRRFPGGHHLMVHGRPFLMLPAELHNSSFSCPNFMEAIWPKLIDSNVNTVLANVSWEDVEPTEGDFNFSKLDDLIRDTRSHKLHLVLLWFGAFKNGKSTYAPRWVKTNPARFPRMMLRNEKQDLDVTDVLSIFDCEVSAADARAFRALMRHLKDLDRADSTVLMVQVENEVGLLGASRDASATADCRFHSSVAPEVIETLASKWNRLHPSLKKNLKVFHENYPLMQSEPLNWPQTFGSSSITDELFMAYHFARYVDTVAQAGKAEYDLPLFTNVWQNYADEDADKSQPVIVGGGGQPGDYPSGGGVINVLDIWHLFAPSLDFIAPDVYLNDYEAVCLKYCHSGQALFIPEQRRDDYGARRVWSAYGTYHALGASPFAIDSLNAMENPWRKHFGLLSQVGSYLLAARETVGNTYGFFFDEYAEQVQELDVRRVTLGRWKLEIERSFVFGRPGPGFGMVIQISDSRFLLVGEGFQVRFASTRKASTFTGILSFLEKVSNPVSKKLEGGRVLNGDETRSGQLAIMPSQQPDLGTFPICITIPARSGIAEVEVYEF